MKKLKKSEWALLAVATVLLSTTYAIRNTSLSKQGFVRCFSGSYEEYTTTPSFDDPFFTALALAAEERTAHQVIYDGSYEEIPYPNGDVDKGKGVCTDVVIRSYRTLGVDLQELIHIDMKNNFISYPKVWRKLSPDANIDHRRVPNQMIFFRRNGSQLPITDRPADYKAGDIIAWDLGEGVLHVGIVSTQIDESAHIPLIVHNIGRGPVLSNVLFKYPIIGHFQYNPSD